MNSKILLIILSFFLFACQEKENEPLVKGDKIPSVVTNINVENLPGAAKISYSLPDDGDLLYVTAEFTSSGGATRIVKSSVYKNHVILDGFGNTDEYEVKLYTVNTSENRSEPIFTLIKPLTPPVQNVLKTLEVFETFGGVAMKFTNENEAEYIFYSLVKDSDGKWVQYDKLYSKSKVREHSIRGFEAEPTEFSFYFVDKWKNHSDTLTTTLEPLYEEEMDKKLWSNAALLDDYYRPRYGPLSELWTPGDRTYFFMYHQDPNLTIPNWFTIDLGRSYQFGRMKVNQVSHSDLYRYNTGAPEIFEIWVSNKPSTNWADWTLLGEFESVKPSGLPAGQLTDEDRRVNAEGEDFTFEPSTASYRYVRFKTLKTWNNVPTANLLELTFWGKAN